jgi:hypothetical protein
MSSLSLGRLHGPKKTVGLFAWHKQGKVAFIFYDQSLIGTYLLFFHWVHENKILQKQFVPSPVALDSL